MPVKFRPLGHLFVVGWQPETKAVAFIARDQVQVQMVYFLPCSLTIGQEEVESDWPQD